MKGAINLRFKNDEFTQADRIEKIKMVHRSCNHREMAMPVRGDRPGDVYEVHDAPAQNVPQKVRILREHKLHHFSARGADWAARKWVFEYPVLGVDASRHVGSSLPRRFGVRS